MNRFIVVYVLQEAYRHIPCQSQGEAQDCLAHVFVREGGIPMGIYDAKTELFHWEATRQHHYDQLCLEEQGRLGHHMIAIAQSLLTPCTPMAILSTAPLQA